jgi:hypothetical protein
VIRPPRIARSLELAQQRVIEPVQHARAANACFASVVTVGREGNYYDGRGDQAQARDTL